ncbi:hypothetical protein BDK61_2644 [Haloarcula quadrata]|uniref:HNH endonuclease n=1 Tax=Haloarcula quadrata TaxID=182779 RepID=A0A495R7L7_9EURY|nr:hypothetical protein [Haloarcula quadrata]RKS83301.1 hypothetical protein BDK61_2644 [Haloarcula quadrata]
MPDDNPRDRHRDRVWSERAGDQCPRCGASFDQAGGADVHHRDGNERNGEPENLRKRCPTCHFAGEHDRPDDAPNSQQPPGPSRSSPSSPRTSPR